MGGDGDAALERASMAVAGPRARGDTRALMVSTRADHPPVVGPIDEGAPAGSAAGASCVCSGSVASKSNLDASLPGHTRGRMGETPPARPGGRTSGTSLARFERDAAGTAAALEPEGDAAIRLGGCLSPPGLELSTSLLPRLGRLAQPPRPSLAADDGGNAASAAGELSGSLAVDGSSGSLRRPGGSPPPRRRTMR